MALANRACYGGGPVLNLAHLLQFPKEFLTFYSVLTIRDLELEVLPLV
jgi:hypothetical protein